MIEIATTRRRKIWYSAAINQKGQLVACAFSDRSRREAENGVRNSLPNMATHMLRADGKRENFRILSDCYDGKGEGFGSRCIDLSWVSAFRRDVYKALRKIPLGKVTTYGEIAKKIRGRQYARAVGTAVATNPLPLLIPCHRVVPSSLRVGNYGISGRNPSEGGYMKRRLLEREGVKFQGEKVSKQSRWTPN